MSDSSKQPEVQAQERPVDEMSDFFDVPMKITCELGRRSMQVREILLLKTESIVEIPKSAGENLDIYVNGKLIAFGEILAIEGNAGVRLTDFYEQA